MFSPEVSSDENRIRTKTNVLKIGKFPFFSHTPSPLLGNGGEGWLEGWGWRMGLAQRVQRGAV